MGAAGVLLGLALVLAFDVPAHADHGTDHQVVLEAPFGGRVTSAPGHHHTPYGTGGDWAMDLAAGAGTRVHVNLAHATGGVSLRVADIRSACSAGAAYGGWLVQVDVTVAGRYLGWIVYAHVNPSVSQGQSLSDGQQIGTIWGGGAGNSCWTGAHVHIEPRNDKHYSCLVPRGEGSSVGTVNDLGVLGGQWRSAKNQACPGGVVGSMNPFGSLDGVSSPAAGQVRVRGWTIDPSREGRTRPNRVHVYVGGHAGDPGAVGYDLGSAAVRRTDVGNAYPWAGSGHGYDTVLATSKTGSQLVCAYGIDVGVGGNAGIGCRTVTIRAAYTLSVKTSGSGAGTVTSSPDGIDCGADCWGRYEEGTRVTLNAAPRPGSTFTGWSGACSGQGPCTVTMSGARTVTAVFDLAPRAGTDPPVAPPVVCATTCTTTQPPATTRTADARPRLLASKRARLRGRRLRLRFRCRADQGCSERRRQAWGEP